MKLKSFTLLVLVINFVSAGCRSQSTLPSTTDIPSATANSQELESNPDTLVNAMPERQPISIENANEIQLLAVLRIPEYSRGRISQCNPAFSPNGRLLAAACGDNPVPIWEVQTGVLVQRLYDPPEHVVACAFNPDGSQIACGGFDHLLTIWDVATGNRIHRFDDLSSPIWDIAFNPGGNFVAACSLGLFGAGPGRGNVRLWNLSDQSSVWSHSGGRDCLSLSFDSSGAVIAIGSVGGSVEILDTLTGEPLFRLTDSLQNIGGLAYSPTGMWLAAGSDDNQIYVWGTPDYSQVTVLEGHTGYVNGVAINPDETVLVSGSHDRTVGVWNMQSHTLITRLQGHEAEVLRVAFSPDGTLIASISWDGTVRLWGVPD